MTVAVKKWGNSLAVRIPKDMAKSLDVDENCEMEMALKDGSLILKPKKKSRLEALVAQIDSSNLHSEVETGECVGNEEW